MSTNDDPVAYQKKQLVSRLFRLAPLVGLQRLTLDGLSRADLDALNLLAQHVEQELARAKQRAREPWRFGH